MRFQETSFGVGAEFEAGRPDLIFESSAGETRECSCGEFRAMKYQIEPTSRPSTAQTRNETRQPKRNMMNAMSGGVNPAPTPTPEKIKPLASPRSEVGIQRATN